jgi:metal-responsive CopG/Arc/MetJ family transcriptional regulator
MAKDKGITVSLSVERRALSEIDKRAAEMDLNRSQYFRRLARADILAAQNQKQQKPKHQPALT